MARPSDAEQALKWSLKQLKAELADDPLPKARRRSLLREYNRAALSLSKLTQLQARLKLQNTKPSHPVTAKEQPKSYLQRWLDEAEGTEPDASGVKDILGGYADEPEAPQPTEIATVNSEPAEGTRDDESEDDDPAEGPDPPAPPAKAEEPTDPAPVEKAEEPDPADANDWLERKLRNDIRHERAAMIRSQVMDLPGEVPVNYGGPPTGESRFSFSDPATKKQTEFYDAWTDPSLGKSHEF